MSSFLSNNRPYDNSRPKAYLNWMVVDEEFAGVTSPNHLGAVQIPVCGAGDTLKQETGPVNMVIRRSGWIYIYLSNESAQDVYFDNLVVNLRHGPLVEQKDYYSFGMEIPGLSAEAYKPGYNQNRYTYNGKELQSMEFSDSSGLDDYDYGARMYDPQICRWLRIDPLSEKMRRFSPYNYAFDNPIRAIDPDGMSPISFNGSGVRDPVVGGLGALNPEDEMGSNGDSPDTSKPKSTANSSNLTYSNNAKVDATQVARDAPCPNCPLEKTKTGGLIFVSAKGHGTPDQATDPNGKVIHIDSYFDLLYMFSHIYAAYCIIDLHLCSLWCIDMKMELDMV